MLEAAVQRYKATDLGTTSHITIAEPDAFFPTFDASNMELRACCTTAGEAKCGVDGEHPAVAGRADACATLLVSFVIHRVQFGWY